MRFVLKNIAASINSRESLRDLVKQKFGIEREQIKSIDIVRQAIDARKKNQLKYNYTLLLDIEGNLIDSPDVLPYKEDEKVPEPNIKLSDNNPFIIGAGPAGLFAALSLVEQGFKPYLFEQGDPVELREKAVKDFWQKGNLDEDNNVQFGEGGAGTFSDGKLTARGKNFSSSKVFDYLINFGASPEIKFQALPHLGTDGIRTIVKRIREYLLSQGVQFFWRHKLKSVKLENNKISSVNINEVNYSPEILILATGNSSRNVFYNLYENKIQIESKPFAVGFRIEHKQSFINRKFYGDQTNIDITGPATYRLTAKSGNKGIYSFCMCPGGYVVGAGSENNSVVVNGMSYMNRKNEFANSAIVTTVNESDYGNNPLDGIKFQQAIERKAFLSKKSYSAPGQRAIDYLENTKSRTMMPNTFKQKVYSYNLQNLYTKSINSALINGLKTFEKRISGFAGKGLLIGPETRTSSPVRIVRDKEEMNSLSALNLYPIGEGSGYAGGIISSAADGYKLGKKFYK